MAKPPKPVAAAFDQFDHSARETLLDTRALIFEVASERDVGPLTETLKWGEPAYLTEATKAGTTLRLGINEDRPALFLNCQTTLVEGYRRDFPGALECEGNRAILLEGADQDALAISIGRALTYHRDKRKGS